MKSTTKKLVKRGARAARKTVDKIETEVMAAVGRKAVRAQVGAAKKAAGQVGRVAAEAALMAGASAAAGMLVRRMRQKRGDG